MNETTTKPNKITSTLAYLILVATIGYGIYSFGGKYLKSKKAEPTSEITESVFQKAMEPIYANPQKIKIDGVGISAQIVQVGVAEDGSLETPKDWKEAGWYYKSSKPGQPGNLIINAHYDDNFGNAAAFWQLKNVKVGDTVSVLDDFGRKYEYQISEYNLISINDPNRSDVFKSDESVKITLITCGGVWIPGKATYDKRLVLKGELIR